MNKNFLIISALIIIIILLAVFAFYKYMPVPTPSKIQNSAGGAQIEKPSDNSPGVQIEVGGVQAEGQKGGGTLTVCLDKCGDGVCQTTDPNCAKDGTQTCICPETPSECSKDCK